MSELEQEKERLAAEFRNLARPEFTNRIAARMFVLISKDAKLTAEDSNPRELSLVEILPASKGGFVRKTVLPETEYPALYNLKAELAWLDSRMELGAK